MPETRPAVSSKFKFITGVGVEFEGGWVERPPFTIHGDSSVTCEGDVRGESHTDPKDSLDGVFDELKVKYPDIVDASCGMHIHISLPELYYSFLTSTQFWTYFCETMPSIIDKLKDSKRKVDYDRFKVRFEGGNHYCKKSFSPWDQWHRTSKDSNRYTMLNYCYGVHHTMECRLFPMCESVGNAKLIISEYLKMVETFLENHKETITYRINPEVIEDDDSGYKEEICV